MIDFNTTLQEHGADPNDCLYFDSDEPGLLPYATLLAARSTEESGLKPLCGVYEWQSTPLAFLVNEQDLRNEDHFRQVRRCVALRGDAPYLALFRPGHLTIHRISLDNDGPASSQLKNVPIDNKRTLFPFLANSRPGTKSNEKWISQIVLKLLKNTISQLQKHGITGNDAISLTGRALFLRFLGDRGLLPPTLGPPEGLFDEAGRAETACNWLNNTFNGDLLPISEGILTVIPAAALHNLGNILRRAPDSQLYLGWEEKWDNLDFAHIPVGVLSEAYEHYMRDQYPDKQREEGSFYTPRAIVNLMVNASFEGLRREGDASKARILDPAAGAGIFLVAAFRQLVADRWARDGRRPNTSELRDILYQQIVGFDINEAALRFAALGLYLMSIELDPEPEPVEKLKFNANIRDTVLFHLGNTGDGLGSLGKGVGDQHYGRYDLVIGNPPWASSTQLPGWRKVTELVTNIAKERLPEDKAFQLLPNEAMDLPFVWRAMQWAKRDAIISFALHARLLFLQGNGMIPARSALFRALDVTGILNGADLCNTRVWPEISVPFCLIFAKNRRPPPGAAFHFVSPHREDRLNGLGILRVDATNADIVTSTQVADRPEIFKILFRGGRLDVEVYDRMATRIVPLAEYWRASFGDQNGRLNQTGNGFQRLRESTINPQKGDHLFGLPKLSAKALSSLTVDTTHLPLFREKFVHRSRSRDIYRAPLLLVQESPPATSGRIRVTLAEQDMVFSQSFHGYSAYGHPAGVRLLRYLALLISSKPAMWYALVTSGRFGVERRVIEKIIIEGIPVVPVESLTSDLVEDIDSIFAAVSQNETPENWARVDAWAAKVYGLRSQDLQIISDTLRFNMPFAEYNMAAQAPPTPNEIGCFCQMVKAGLYQWAQRENKGVEVQQVPLPLGTPWKMIQIYAHDNNRVCPPTVNDWPQILRVADSAAATAIIYPNPSSSSLVVARLNQARYWSGSQAQLVTRQIVWEHLSSLFGEESE